MKIKILLILIISITIIYIISNYFTYNQRFTKEKWNYLYFSDYKYRKYIVNDLRYNILNSEYCYEEIIKLLGDGEINENDKHFFSKNPKLFYQIEETVSGFIDINHTHLMINLTKDSCFKNSHIIKSLWDAHKYQ